MVGRGSDGTMRRSKGRALLAVAALVLLLVTVGIASTGDVPAGAGGTRRPAERLVDVLISLYLVLMVVGAGLWVYLFAIRRDVLAASVAARRGRNRWASFASLVAGLGLLALFLRWLSADESLRRRIVGQDRPPTAIPSAATTAPDGYQPQFATRPVLVVLVVLTAAAAAWFLSSRARRRRLEPAQDSVIPALADVLEETLDDLRAECDPRRAVIAAYARMERALGAFGLPRHPSEAPDEYLRRIFSDLDVGRSATSRLTALFSWAKFSRHDVAPAMKQEAIEALEAVRSELRAADLLASREHPAGAGPLRERTEP